MVAPVHLTAKGRHQGQQLRRENPLAVLFDIKMNGRHQGQNLRGLVTFDFKAISHRLGKKLRGDRVDDHPEDPLDDPLVDPLESLLNLIAKGRHQGQRLPG